RNFAELTWVNKLGILYNLSHGLLDIHNARLVHKNLHCGNILRHYNGSQSLTYITDIGQSRPANTKPRIDPKSKKISRQVFGVLPFIAPEVLRGGEYTDASDTYSFGIVMWEIATSRLPFNDRAHDEKLAWDICD